MTGTIWTLGHWTSPVDAVLATLRSAEIDELVDVRKLPGSRRSPQFDAEEMTRWLGGAGIGYRRSAELTGRRPKQRDVDPQLNAGWQNTSFRNYADHTLSAEYEQGIEELEALAAEHHVAVMCGEPMPWRCHRLLISNTLVARGWEVVHLRVGSAPAVHELGAWGARPIVREDGTVIYPPEAQEES
ncbi:DUF488 domain-containing protein [Brachybacterium paraconglomeratum]|uniref:DUF488 domain-containing protein n=1 Tax=Brachybacterium paraconglomeratum TaxID=173362 RepID=UPI0021A88A07|nr:DUF488 domain-containing protein [Brachybacterium paraconglomeratum]MCT1908114.1 DUF488 domain-containing protein [Brachybacterium paraconglomeratum]